MKAESDAMEALVVSTCNRIMWVTAGGSPTFDPCGLLLTGHGAIRHLCRVAAGLESLVLGEPQILAQIKEAWMQSRESNCSGRVLEFLMPRVLGLAKRVRKQSGLGRGAVSVAHIGVEHALRLHSKAQPEVLLIGAGKMAAIAIRQLRARGVRSIHVANRTYENALLLGNGHGVCPVAYREIYKRIQGSADIVICACAAPHPILSAGNLAPGRELVIVDLALPRNVDPAAAQVDGVALVDLDALAATVQAGYEVRRQDALQAEGVLAGELAKLHAAWRRRASHAAIKQAQAAWDALRETELAKTRRSLANLSEAEWRRVESFAWRLTRKLTHDSVRAIGTNKFPAEAASRGREHPTFG